jgi:hypothetical protein
MTMLVSLGCRCHPAWWMRKLNIRVLSLPFDWLLSPPHVGLDYALQLHTNGFDGWLDGLAPSALGHPVAARYPQVELFHHDALLSPDADVRDAERRRMARRAAAFADVVAAGRIDFL